MKITPSGISARMFTPINRCKLGLREGAARPWMVTRSWLAWTPDGNGLVVADRNEGGRGFDLFLVPLSYGPRRRLTTPSPGWGDSAPAFAPGGRSLAFIRSLSAVDGDVFVLPLTAEFGPASEPRRLSSLHRLTSGLTWTADGHDIVFASGQIGASRLWRVSVATGAAPQLVPFVAEDALWPSISSEGHLAYAVSQSDTDIWRTPLDGSGAPQRWIASTR